MFSIGLRFLMGRYYAQSPARNTDSLKPTGEWPPAPDRLFSALVAAAYIVSDSLSAADQAALEWLEQLSPPAWAGPLLDPDETNGRVVQAAVPKNYKTSKRIFHGNAFRYFTSIAVDTPGYWVWADADPTPHLSSLTTLVNRVAYLGSSESFVSLWVEPNPPVTTLAPASEGPVHMTVRLPYPGRLATLNATYQHPLTYPPPGPAYGYRRVKDETIAQLIREGPYDQLGVWTLEPATPRSIASTLMLTSRLRSAVMAQSRVLHEPIPATLSGHGPGPHCAYLALPHVGFPHSDGHIVALAVAIPQHLTESDRQTIYRFLGSLRTLHIDQQTYRLLPSSLDAPLAAQPERWSRPSTYWISVSPVIFDRFPTTRRPLIEAVQTMARHAGLPEVHDAQIIRSPAMGVPPSQEFLVRRKHDDMAGFVSHLAITFAERVRGPVLLGRLRHFGVGLFVPQPPPKGGISE